MINKIIEETGVKIDITDDGAVNVCGTDQEMIDKAIATIRNIVTDVEPGMIYTGKVVRIMEFGAFVELAPNKDGMVHISKLSDKRVAKVEDVVNIGDEVTVRVVEVDRMGRINLTMRPEDMTADLEKLTRPERRERSDARRDAMTEEADATTTDASVLRRRTITSKTCQSPVMCQFGYCMTERCCLR